MNGYETQEKGNGCVFPGFALIFGAISYASANSISRLTELAASTGDKLPLYTAEAATGLFAIAAIGSIIGALSEHKSGK